MFGGKRTIKRGKRLIKRGKKRYVKKEDKLVEIKSKLSNKKIREELIRSGKTRTYKRRIPDMAELLANVNKRRADSYAEYLGMINNYNKMFENFKANPNDETKKQMDTMNEQIKKVQTENINLAKMYKQLSEESKGLKEIANSPEYKVGKELIKIGEAKPKNPIPLGHGTGLSVISSESVRDVKKQIEINEREKNKHKEKIEELNLKLENIIDTKDKIEKELSDTSGKLFVRKGEIEEIEKRLNEEKELAKSILQKKDEAEMMLRKAEEKSLLLDQKNKMLEDNIAVRKSISDINYDKHEIELDIRSLDLEEQKTKDKQKRIIEGNKIRLQNDALFNPFVLEKVDEMSSVLTSDQRKELQKELDKYNKGDEYDYEVFDKTTNILLEKANPFIVHKIISDVENNVPIKDITEESVVQSVNEMYKEFMDYNSIKSKREDLNKRLDSLKKKEEDLNNEIKNINQNDDVIDVSERLDASNLGESSIQEGEGKDKPLETVDINKMMDGLMNQSGFSGFIGTYAADMIPIEKIEDVYEHDPYGIISMVINTDNHDEKGEHWTALLFNFRDETIEYYDSYGYAAPQQLLDQVQKVLDEIEHPNYLKFKENAVQQQKYGTNTCGYHAMKFILDRYNDVPFPTATGFDKSEKGEKEINKIKKKFDKYM